MGQNQEEHVGRQVSHSLWQLHCMSGLGGLPSLVRSDLDRAMEWCYT